MKIRPVTLYFSQLSWYHLNPLLEVARDPHAPMLDIPKSGVLFKQMCQEVYIPVLDSLQNNGVEANIVLTGEFLATANLVCPELIEKLKQLIENDEVSLVADAYYGNSLTSLYNSAWWASSVKRTVDATGQILSVSPAAVYIPQLYRGLELERITQNSGISEFFCRVKGTKPLELEIKLSSLRRFGGRKPGWIDVDMDLKCSFHFIADDQFFSINEAYFEKDLDKSGKTISLEIPYTHAKLELKPKKTKTERPQKPSRLSEKYSLTLYSPLQRAVIRLWEYGAMLVWTEFNQNPGRVSNQLLDTVAALQNSEFLYYLSKKSYRAGQELNFSSPYEAFVNMQAAIKQVEILLKNKI
jgi:Glycosyl hydrolase family 57